MIYIRLQCTYTSLLEAKQRRQKRSQDIANSNNKLGLDFGTDMTEERALDQLLLDDTAGGQKRVMDGPLSNAHLFA